MNTNYPLLSKESSYRLRTINYSCDDLLKGANTIKDEADEIAYLRELELFYTNNYMSEITKIKKRTDMIERAKNFDCNMVKNLPDDIICSIKGYLEPELNFTRKFSILRQINSGFAWWRDIDDYLIKVPKKLIIALKKSCCIIPRADVVSRDSKEAWCRMIDEETAKLFCKNNDLMRVDKLLAGRECEWGLRPQLDRWFMFFLYIHTFKKYRATLEGKLKKTDEKISSLKKTDIVVVHKITINK